MPKLYSLDVFDTCVTRSYFRPSDLLIDLALQTVMGTGGNDRAAYRLFIQRNKAERTARINGSGEDTSISRIYASLSEIADPAVDLSAMMAREIQLELDSNLQVKSTYALYKKLVADGEKVIFTSDMYLPKDTIMEILGKCGYEARADNTYVSGDTGLLKATGNLFRHVAENNKVPFSEIVHFGDNLHSDFLEPSKLGIEAHHITPIEPDKARNSRGSRGRSVLGRAGNALFRLTGAMHLTHERRFIARPLKNHIAQSRASVLRRAHLVDGLASSRPG